MTTAVTDVPMTLTEGLLALLRLYEAPGAVYVTARSEGGIGQAGLEIAPPVLYLPAPLCKLIEERWGLQISATTRGRDGSPAAYPVAWAHWPVALDFSAATDWKHRPRPEALAAIAERLAAFPCAPTIVIDGVRELAAVWHLEAPLDCGRDAARILALQRGLAARLGADVTAGESLETWLPLPGGIVRNVGSDPPVVTFAGVAPDRRYPAEVLEQAAAAEAVAVPAPKKGRRA